MNHRLLAAATASVLAALSTAACGGGSSVPVVKATAVPTTAPKINTQALWVANGANVVEFGPSQLTSASADPAPQAAIDSSVFGAPQGVQFDKNGNLWVIDGGTLAAGGTVAPALFEFTPQQLSQLHGNASPAPNATIRFSGFTFPQQGVFDKNGNFWVTDNGANTVDVFSPSELASGGANVTPIATISAGFTGPLGLAFDPSGDLYVANNGTTTIFGFKASKLPTAGNVTLTPDVTISDDGAGSIQAAWALVFDQHGDLWSSNANAPFTLVEFSPQQIAANGAPKPIVTLAKTTVGGNVTLNAPNGIAFDSIGDLAAISSATPFGVADFGFAQLTSSAPVPPTAFLAGATTTLNAPAGDVFGMSF